MQEDAIKKSEVLIEALPYIRAFHGKKIVIKYGGSAIANKRIRKNILDDIVFMSYAGMKPVLVHGGGPFINKRMKKLGKKQKFVKGLRVTSEEDVQVINQVLSRVNRQIVNEINKLGGKAQSVLRRNCVIKVRKHKHYGDIGSVGDIVSIDSSRIENILDKGVVPVIAPLGVGRDGKTYNINADQASAAIAGALAAEKLAFLTNVEGILDKRKKGKDILISALNVKKVKNLIDRKVIDAGMIPKVKACIYALKRKVKKVHIVNAGLLHALLLEIFTDEGIGTEVVK